MATCLKCRKWVISLAHTGVVIGIGLMLLLSTTQAATAKTVLRVATWGDISIRNTWLSLIKEYQKSHSDVDIKLENTSLGLYFQKLQVMAAGGAAPDIMEMDDSQLVHYASEGMLENLDSWISKDRAANKPGQVDLGDFFPVGLKLSSYKGHLYTLPQNFPYPTVLYYNKTLFDRAHLPYPDDTWTWNTLVETGKKLMNTLNTEGKTEVWAFQPQPFFAWTFVWSNGGSLVNEDGTRVLLDSDEAVQALQFYSDLVYKYKIAPTMGQQAALGGMEWYQTFNTGKVAMYQNGRWVIPQHRKITDFKWDVAPIPKSPYTGKRVNYVSSQAFGISASSQHKAEAWEFLKYLGSPVGQRFFVGLGMGIPVLKSVANSPEFLNAGPPRNNEVFLDAIQNAQAMPQLRNWDEVMNALLQTLGKVWNGETHRPIKEIMSELVPKLDKTLNAR